MNRPAKVTQGEIARPRLRHLERHVTRHGKVTWYVRRGHGPRIPVAGEPGTDEFIASYKAIVSGKEAPIPIPKVEKTATEKGVGFVYFLRVGDTIKIGFSTSPMDRLQALKTGLPGPVKMFLAVPGTHRAERTLHAQLSEYCIVGEWFKATPAVMKAAARYAFFAKVRLK